MRALLLSLLLGLAAPGDGVSLGGVDLGIFQVAGLPPVNLTATAERLLGSLSAARGVHAANATLAVTERVSFHMFATNRTETCHFHPGDTTSTVLWGHGMFYSNSSAPAPQPRGSVYFIPRGAPHAFGHVGLPTVVTVAWSPPFHPGYTIPTQGCIALPPHTHTPDKG